MNIQEILSKIQGCRKKGQGWMGFCPAHDDGAKHGKRSLSIGVGADDKVLLKCFAGCEFDDILKAAGIESQRNQKGEDSMSENFDYKDEQGKVLFQVVRNDRSGKKTFYQQAPDGKGGWKKNLQGVQRVLYHLPEVIQARKKGKLICIAEGEKCADRLCDLGFVATCNPGGAGKWRPEFSNTLRESQVVIFPDNDEPGRKHAHAVMKSLLDVDADVEVVEIPGVKEKGDIFDYLEGYPTNDKAKKAVDALIQKARQDNIQTLEELLKKEIPPMKWAIQGLLPEGLTILAAKPKSGKSILALNWALQVAQEGEVLYLALEDSERRLQERVRSMIGEKDDTSPLSRVHLKYDLHPLDQGGVEEIRKWIKRHPDTKLIVLDVLGKVWTQGKGRTGNAYNDDYHFMSNITDLVKGSGIAFLLVHHTRKTKADYVFDEISGTTAISGSADTVMVLERKGGKEAVLHATGRDIDATETALRLDEKTMTWRFLGDAKQHLMSQERKDIRDWLMITPMTSKALADKLKKNPSTIRTLLQKMKEQGLVERMDDGKYRNRVPQGGGNDPQSPPPSTTDNSKNAIDSIDSIDRPDSIDSIDRDAFPPSSVHAVYGKDLSIDSRNARNDGQLQGTVYSVYGVYTESQKDTSPPCVKSEPEMIEEVSTPSTPSALSTLSTLSTPSMIDCQSCGKPIPKDNGPACESCIDEAIQWGKEANGH